MATNIIIVITIYLLANLLIGLITGKKIEGFVQFSVGNRKFGSALIFCTLTASYLGGGYTIGAAGKVYQTGLIYAFALLGFSVKELLVAYIIAPKMAKFQDCVSVGDIVGKTYGKSAQVLTGIFSVFICAGILGAQVIALSVIFTTLIPNVDTFYLVLGSFAVIVLYCTVGGMSAVVYTDVFQFIILGLGIPLVFFMSLYHVGGWSNVAHHVPIEMIWPFSNGHDVITLIGLFFALMFGEILVPPYVQRLLMSDPKATRLGTLMSAFFSVPCFLMVASIGLLVLSSGVNIDPDTALPYAILHFSPAFLRGILLASLAAIIMSSASSFLNAGAVAFTNDIVKCLKPDLNDDNALLVIAKLATVVIGLLALNFSLISENALDVLLAAYQLWSPIVLVPLVAAIFGVKGRPVHFLLGGLSGFALVHYWDVLGGEDLMNPVFAGIIVNLVVFLVAKQVFPVARALKN